MHLYPGRGRALELSGRYDEAIADYEAMQDRRRGRRGPDGHPRCRPGAGHAVLDAHAEVRSEARARAVGASPALARELGERRAESKALWNLMIVNVFGGGDLREALDAGERSLVIARELDAA